MEDLASRNCVPCHGGVPKLSGEEISNYVNQLRGWEVVDDHHLKKAYKFSNFIQALDFVNAIGALAEQQGHHPDICFGWGKTEITLFTHAIDGLSESDFVLAAKIDRES
ncbi:MAG: 4a-hydroxytetrahydrobiopterin dehydratase [Pyrinomonadaceae bacterium]